MKKIVILTIALGIVLSLPGLGQQVKTTKSTYSAIFSLKNSIEIKNKIIEEKQKEYLNLTRKRENISRDLSELYMELNNIYANREPEEYSEDIKELEERTNKLRNRLNRLTERARMLGDQVEDAKKAVAHMKTKIEELKANLPDSENNITGNWDIVMFPNQIKGEIRLIQRGTIVEGEYELEGGWSGSLQGHIANNRVVLERIDSELGKVGTLVGTLSDNGNSIKGNWENYELSRSPTRGSWTATRVSN